MTNLHPVPRNQESEALYWLDLARRILGGDIRPDEALHVLKLSTLYLEASEAEGDRRHYLRPSNQPGKGRRDKYPPHERLANSVAEQIEHYHSDAINRDI